jgi:RNA polymerase sigma-54 factor
MRQAISTTQKYKLKLLPYQYLALRVLKFSLRELKDFLIDELRRGDPVEISDKIEPREFLINKTPTLQEHLLAQLRLELLSEYEIAIGEEIIGNLNDDGYLMTRLEEIATTLNAALSEAEKVLHIIQEFDPYGVGARTLSECLLIQLKAQDKANSLEYKIVEKYLKEAAGKKFGLISKKIKVNEKNVRDAAAQIVKLNPKPGSIFTAPSVSVIPDMILSGGKGGFVLTLNEEAESILRTTADYHLIKAIQRRNKTLQHIAEYITQNQMEFLREGFCKLKPLTIEKLANALGMHKSTISRAVANKFVETREGIFKLKDLFAGAVKTKKDAPLLSTKAIKEIIKGAIEKEGKLHPLTDRMIKERLSRRGFDISRRAIAKYRNQLRISPSYLRS